MDTERRNAAEERRVRKLQQIKQLLSIVLGPDVDLNQEARDVIKQWEKLRLFGNQNPIEVRAKLGRAEL